jgi:predicted component of type VI protein secretion system
MDVKLVIEKGRQRRVVRLAGDHALVGRAKGVHIRIPSADISRKHCRLDVEDGMVVVEDLDSVNGTFLNGERVEGRQVVAPGDRLTLGPVRFIVEYEMSADGVEALQTGEPDYDMLEALEADQVVEVELEVLDDEVVEAEPVGDAQPTEEEPMEVELANPEMDMEAQPWRMPTDGGDIRDLIAEMDDPDAPPREPKKKKRK